MAARDTTDALCDETSQALATLACPQINPTGVPEERTPESMKAHEFDKWFDGEEDIS